MHTILIACESHKQQAQAIADHLKLPLHEVVVTHFADSEISVGLKASAPSLASLHAIVVHSTSYPVNENLVELLLTLQMLKNKGVKKITAVIPYFGYARQDRLQGGESVAGFVLRLLQEAGADSVVTVELHNPNIIDDAPLPVTNIVLTDVIADYIAQQEEQNDLTIIAPDRGALGRVEAIADRLDASTMVYDKERYAVNKTRITASSGTCKTLKGIIVDDIIDTGSTMMQVADKLHDEHSSCHMFAFAVHPVLSGDARRKLQESYFERIWITNTITWDQGTLPDKFVVVDISKYIADSLRTLI